MVFEYYSLREWIDERLPKAKLEELGLKWVAYRVLASSFLITCLHHPYLYSTPAFWEPSFTT
ncbi:MAG: hypothetical protein B7O98_07850 [Zestosphaera tikiterensis]|uniref:Uncharacterized protein n=1 Tax=Zestosphaera tikiterensis TaxID=1973259 RepID=A0A2R7Y4T3_9CREN|nr:MAG: hypothetical protein B7O98_07850 [Zestosphaera tikiterensis]